MSFLCLPSRLFFLSCFLIFSDTIFSHLSSKRYVYFPVFSSLHQWLNTQEMVDFVPPSLTLGNKTCLSPFLWLFTILFKARPCSSHLQLPFCEESQQLQDFLNSSPKLLNSQAAAIRTAWLVTPPRSFGFFLRKSICTGLQLWWGNGSPCWLLLVALWNVLLETCFQSVFFSLHLSLLCQL